MKKILVCLLSALFVFSAFAEDYSELDFINKFNVTAFSSQKKLTLMHKPNNMAKLGKETIDGDLSGTLFYNAAVKGLGGDVQMLYTDYCDFEGLIVNGETNTRAKMDSSGTMYGQVIVTDSDGNELGKIDFSKVIIKKAAPAGGSYGVTLPGKETVWIPWNEIIQNKKEN